MRRFQHLSKRKEKFIKKVSQIAKTITFSFFLLSCSLSSSNIIVYNEDEFYQELNQKLSIINRSASRNFSLLINTSTELRHKGNLSLAYQVLVERSQKYEDFILLDASGEPTPLYPLSGSFDRTSFKKVLEYYRENITEKDTLVVYITGHGTMSGLPSELGEVSKQEIVEACTKLNPKFMFVFVDVCYWEADDFVLNVDNVVISTTNKENTSYGNNFSRLFWRQFRETPSSTIMDAFVYSKDNDRGTKEGKNRPVIKFSNTAFVSLTGN